MSNKRLLTIILLATLALAGIVWIQTVWLKNAVKLKEEELGVLARKLTREAFEQKNDSEKDPLLHASETEVVEFSEDQKMMLLAAIRKVTDSTFRANGIYDPYAIGVLPCTCEDLLASSDPELNAELLQSKIRTSLTAAEGSCDMHYLVSLHFTNKNSFLLGQLGPQLLVYILLIVILAGVFAYTIITLRRQKRLSEVKNDFINNMTHELKTPIASIRLASRMLQKGEEEKEKGKTYIQLIEKESKRLENQVDKVLQAALMDSGNFQLEKRTVDVHETIQRAVANFDLVAENRKGSIRLELNARTPVIEADEVHLTNALYNLIDNALKYCAKPPEILVKTTDDTNGVLITVKDNGIGISSGVQQYIFEKFYRAEGGNVHNVKGFGLGLSYVKSIMDAHRGRIHLRSEPNRGSEFNLFFPTI